MKKKAEYYWIRVFDYVYERDSYDKGTMLDEYYLIETDRELVKQNVRDKYCGHTSQDLKFAKPKRKNGIYAVVMESEKFFYDRFYASIDTICFMCSTSISGKASEYPREYIGEDGFYNHNDDVFTDLTKTAYFCCYDCKLKFGNIIRSPEGEFQIKEEGDNGDTFAYIYLITNRTAIQSVQRNAGGGTGPAKIEDGVIQGRAAQGCSYYIGQTRFLPFFRWQEHVKSRLKGDINDLAFSVLTEIKRDRRVSDDQNQLYTNSMEAWWIKKYRAEGYNVINIAKPKITVQYLKDRFFEMVDNQPLLLPPAPLHSETVETDHLEASLDFTLINKQEVWEALRSNQVLEENTLRDWCLALLNEIESPSPEGRNYTNDQYNALKAELERFRNVRER